MSYEREEIMKRRAERKKRIRRRRIFTAFLSFVFISLLVLVILCFTVLFPIKTVSAKGSKLYTAEQIVTASGITEKNNLFTVSEKELTEKIRVKLPFVDAIEIKRELPDTLIITATDAKECACIKDGDTYYTLSRKGYVLSSYPEKPEGVFLIVCNSKPLTLGEKAELKKENEINAISLVVDNLTTKKIVIDYIDVSDILNITAKVEGRFVVNFGNSANLDKKIAHLSAMVSKIEENKTGKINLSMWTSQKTEGTFVEGDIN